jgi:hypothetical protein
MPFLLMLLGGAKSVFGAVLAWLSKRSMAELACIALALVCLVQFVALKAEKRHSAKLQAQVEKCTKARATDKAAYEQAQKDASAKNIAHVEQIQRKQEAITNEVKSDLNSRLERIRRELHDHPALKGSAGGTDLPKSGPAPCRAVSAAWLCVSPEERLRAAENEERHDQLINWVERQSR